MDGGDGMRMNAVLVCLFGAAVTAASFGQGLGFSKGMMAGDSSYTLDITSPYLHAWGSQYVAARLSGDVMAKEGVLSGEDTDSIVWPAYFTGRLGIALATLPRDSLRLYAGAGGMALFPTGTIASSLGPSLGFYVDTGVEFFLDDGKHATMFLEVGTAATLGKPAAAKMRQAPILGNGPVALAGARYYF